MRNLLLAEPVENRNVLAVFAQLGYLAKRPQNLRFCVQSFAKTMLTLALARLGLRR